MTSLEQLNDTFEREIASTTSADYKHSGTEDTIKELDKYIKKCEELLVEVTLSKEPIVTYDPVLNTETTMGPIELAARIAGLVAAKIILVKVIAKKTPIVNKNLKS